VIKRLYLDGKSGIPKDKYNALLERAIEIGAADLDDEEEATTASTPPPRKPAPKPTAKKIAPPARKSRSTA
jgi:hypothetical protein